MSQPRFALLVTERQPTVVALASEKSIIGHPSVVVGTCPPHMGRGCSGPARVAWYVETYEAWEQVPACWAEYPAMVSDLQAAMELRLAIDAETAGDMLAAARGGADWHDYRGRLMERGRVPWVRRVPSGASIGSRGAGTERVQPNAADRPAWPTVQRSPDRSAASTPVTVCGAGGEDHAITHPNSPVGYVNDGPPTAGAIRRSGRVRASGVFASSAEWVVRCGAPWL